jgi:hypothetical protein
MSLFVTVLNHFDSRDEYAFERLTEGTGQNRGNLNQPNLLPRGKTESVIWF